MDENSQMLFLFDGLFFVARLIKVQLMQCCTAPLKQELIMSPIDISAIERRARQLRAEEIRRVEGLFIERLRVLGRLMASSIFAAVLALATVLRPLFSWNPQDMALVQQNQRPRISLLTRLNRSARSLFAWNPEVHHHV